MKEAIIIQNIAVKRRVDITLTNTNIITYTAVSIFLPYVLTAIILAFLSIYILANRHTRQLVFIHSGCRPLKLFFLYVLIVPFMYGNWLGLLVGIGMILVMILGLYLRSVMSRELYERVLTIICTLSLTSAGYAITEALINYFDHGSNRRISAVFSHPNYFGTIIATVIIICAYKILTSSESKLFYIVIGIVNTISLYLCKSMFAFIEVFIGVLILLFLLKKNKLLMLWISAAVLGAFLIFGIGVNLVPRLRDAGVTIRLREQIWQLATDKIKENPVFGHGYMSFLYLIKASYRSNTIPHSHSIYLDTILNFGVVGTILLLGYYLSYYRSVITLYIKKQNVIIPTLIFAVTAAGLVHGATDLTMFWIQTLPLYFLIFAGIGSEEKKEHYGSGIELL
jgi:O-antigen ligase